MTAPRKRPWLEALKASETEALAGSNAATISSKSLRPHGAKSADSPANCTSPQTHGLYDWWHDVPGLGWFCVAWACLPDEVKVR
jgi:hypothetical protein